MSEVIDKALIRPGKPSLAKRVAFLLSTNRNERNYRIGRYLEGRKAGKAIPGTKRPRKGFYGGVYATGVNKAGSEPMDVIEALDAEIEKAVSFRGVRMSPSQRRAVAMGGRRRADVWRERGLLQVRVGGIGGKRRGVRGHQAKTTPSRTQRAIAARLRKSEAQMDCIDELNEAIEKARGLMPRGGSGRVLRNLNGRGGRKLSHITMARVLAYRSGHGLKRVGRDGMTMVSTGRKGPKRR